VRAWSVAICVAGVLASTSASAEDATLARQHYARGTDLFDLHRYRDAAKEYELAFEAKPDGVLLFNIAQAYRLAGDYGEAISYYKSYLRRIPRATNRTEVEARIGEMQRLLEEQRQAQERPPAGTMAPEVRPPAEGGANAGTPAAPTEGAPIEGSAAASHDAQATPARAGRAKLFAGIGLAAGGAALIGLAGGFYALGQGEADAIATPGSTFDPSRQDRLNSYAALDVTFFIVGGAAIATGATLAILGWRQQRASARSMAWR
jgi:tetratricopeptide (TPR) repeat protein